MVGPRHLEALAASQETRQSGKAPRGNSLEKPSLCGFHRRALRTNLTALSGTGRYMGNVASLSACRGRSRGHGGRRMRERYRSQTWISSPGIIQVFFQAPAGGGVGVGGPIQRVPLSGLDPGPGGGAQSGVGPSWEPSGACARSDFGVGPSRRNQIPQSGSESTAPSKP